MMKCDKCGFRETLADFTNKLTGEQMKKVIIEIECENAAFDGMPEAEVARLLFDLAKSIDNGNIKNRALIDLNGNKCGSVIIC